MKLARFRIDGWESYGLVEGDRIRVIQGNILGEHQVTQASYPLDRVKLLPPTQPTCYWAIGLNYAAHVAHQEGALDAERIRRESRAFALGIKAPIALLVRTTISSSPPTPTMSTTRANSSSLLASPPAGFPLMTRPISSLVTLAPTMSAARAPGITTFPIGARNVPTPSARSALGLRPTWATLTSWILLPASTDGKRTGAVPPE